MFKNKIRGYVGWFILAVKTIKMLNIIPALFLRLGLKKEIKLQTKTIGEFYLKYNEFTTKTINNIMSFQYYVLNNNVSSEKIKSFNQFIVSMNDEKDTITYDDINYLKNNHTFILCENFYESGNSPFDDFEDCVIIDVGCNIADTSLSFAKKGCEVYGFEPVPDIYDIAIKNVNLNPNLKDKIHLYNYAISDKNEEITIFYEELMGSGSSRYGNQGKKYLIKSITLNDVINKLKKRKNMKFLLQMDCEGSEFDIIPKSDLTIFNELVIEYHSKMRNLPKDLLICELEKQGFEIKEIYTAPGINLLIDDIGIIHAINKNK